MTETIKDDHLPQMEDEDWLDYLNDVAYWSAVASWEELEQFELLDPLHRLNAGELSEWALEMEARWDEYVETEGDDDIGEDFTNEMKKFQDLCREVCALCVRAIRNDIDALDDLASMQLGKLASESSRRYFDMLVPDRGSKPGAN